MKKRRYKKEKLKKNTFIEGAFIATLGIVISKVLGILYVIPFYSVIGEKGGALYGYAYSLYLLFMAISSAGIPLAISKVISEYQTLGYLKAKEKALLIGKKLSLALGIFCFLILFIFARVIASTILGDLKGGNTIDDVTFVIRVISTAIIIVPLLSVYRGYFEGHKFITPTSISQVLEQIIRVLIIVIGSFMTLNVFHASLTNAVGVALFGATAGAIFSYLYLVEKKFKNKSKFKEKKNSITEPKISDKAILRKIIIYAVPLIMIDVFKALYGLIDSLTVVRALGSIYGIKDAEAIISIISTWGAKFNMIIISVSTGLIVSLIPNLTSLFVSNNKKEVNNRINQTFQVLLFIIIPLTLLVSFLSEPIYMLFYGPSKYGSSVISIYIYVALATALFTTAVTIIQVLKYYKFVFISLLTGFIIKLLLNTSLIYYLNSLGLHAFYGSIIASIISYSIAFIMCLIFLNVKCKVNYEETFNQLMNIVFGTIIMTITLFVLKQFIPITSSNRFINLFIIAIYSIISISIYYLYMSKTKSVKKIFGRELIKKRKA